MLNQIMHLDYLELHAYKATYELHYMEFNESVKLFMNWSDVIITTYYELRLNDSNWPIGYDEWWRCTSTM